MASVGRRPAVSSSSVGVASDALGVVKPSSLAVAIRSLTGLSLTVSLRSGQDLLALLRFGGGQQFLSLVDEAVSDEAIAICFEMHWIQPPTSVFGLHHLA